MAGMLRSILTVCRKETRDNARDKRTLMRVFLLGPLLGPILFAGMMSVMIQMIAGSAEEPLKLPVAGADRAPHLVAYLRAHHTEIQAPPDDAAAAIKAGKVDVVLQIPASYPADFIAGEPAQLNLVLNAADQSAEKSVRRVKALLNAYGSRLAGLRLLARGVSPATIHPIAVVEHDISTPAARGAVLLGMVPYFCLFAVLIGGFYLAIDTTAGERERGSLEPLLGTAAPRAAIMLGKLTATALFSIVSLAIAVGAFGISIPLMPLGQLGVQLNFGAWEVVWVFITCLPFAALSAALLTLVAAFSRSFKEAQAWLSVVLVVPVLPLIFTAVHPVHPKLWMMLIPSLSQDLLITGVMKGEPLANGFLALSAASTLVVAAVLAAVTVHLYRRERLIV
ncbi:MAG TPA: ABC transporter permease [Gammaproteobacteria bacterium]|nr:ABC transporter permease [Gammaproteobacteria bacterium]